MKMETMEKIIEEDLMMDREDDMDIYSNKNVDDLIDNGEISAQEAAFMRGYNEAEV